MPRRLMSCKVLFTRLSVHISQLWFGLTNTHTTFAVGLEPPFMGVIRIAQKDVTISSVSIKKNDHLVLDIVNANLEVRLRLVRFQYSQLIHF